MGEGEGKEGKIMTRDEVKKKKEKDEDDNYTNVDVEQS